uniref:ARAD1A13904p n=1 Tax=Blastobotrys adeninivorans TaxID=409370 RepID=A0A060SXL6_BLAAD
METIEIHSKSFMIKWVHVPEDATVEWQIKPLKKSINFGLFMSPQGPASGEFTVTDESGLQSYRRGSAASTTSGGSGSVEKRMEDNGLHKVLWHGKCAADVLAKGHFKVPKGNGGMYALIFDNSFSKTTAKTVLFSQRVSKESKPGSVSTDRNQSLSVPGGALGAHSAPGVDSGAQVDQSGNPAVMVAEPSSSGSAGQGDGSTAVSDGRHLSGPLLKKRRKKMQGYARRYFSLDCETGMLSYYLGQKSSFLRGTMAVPICVISVHRKTRDIFIDSGMEIWSLRAVSMADFDTWVSSLKAARRLGLSGNGSVPHTRPGSPRGVSQGANDEDQRWAEVTKLVNRLETISDEAKNVQFDATGSQTSLADASDNINNNAGNSNSNSGERLQRKPSFWRRRKSSAPSNTDTNKDGVGRSLGAAESSASLIAAPNVDEWRDITNKLQTLVLDFQYILASRNRVLSGKHAPVLSNSMFSFSGRDSGAGPRHSLDEGSLLSEDEFFDATEGVVYMDDDRESSESQAEEGEEEVDESEVSSDEEDIAVDVKRESHPIPQHDLYPLPADPVKRRTQVPPSNGNPPSIVSIMRKNVGKDMSTVAMPVTLNEPITIVQHMAEIFEYSEILDRLAKSTNAVERAMLAGLFSVSIISPFRSKERCMRKPFNPMLGETFELVREDKGFRMLCEKVSHRPVGLALHAESALWTVQYSGKPNQKFWGKSIELIDTGTIKITINQTGEVLEFLQPSMFMRNIIAGEKYIEPSGSATVYSSSGARSIVEYKAGGMFSGRSEDVTIRGYDAGGSEVRTVFQGKWTDRVLNSSSGESLWQVGQLVKDANKHYGFTEFAASLNEATNIEQGKLAPTDSRLRTDLRYYEQGQVDQAEKSKHELEEAQRARRREMESTGKTWAPLFFDKEPSSSKDTFVIKKDSANYWSRRAAGNWDGLPKLW